MKYKLLGWHSSNYDRRRLEDNITFPMEVEGDGKFFYFMSRDYLSRRKVNHQKVAMNSFVYERVDEPLEPFYSGVLKMLT